MNDRLPLAGVLPMHCSANVGEDGRVARLLRALRDREDDVVGRPRPLADRRRRARLERQWRLQHRGRLLRQGDQALGGGRAGDLADDADVRDDSRERRGRRGGSGRSRRRREDGEHARRVQARAHRERPADETRGSSELRRLPRCGRVRRPAADRATLARPGDVLVPLGLHREARGHRARRHRASADVLDVLRRAVPAAAAPGVRADARREARQHGASVWLVNTGWTGGPFGVGHRMPITATRGLLHAALSGALDGVEYRTDPVFGFDVPVSVPGVDSALLDPRGTWADPGAYDAKARSWQRCSARTSRRRSPRTSTRPSPLPAHAPRERQTARLVVTASDYDAALAFYRDVLGLEELGLHR